MLVPKLEYSVAMMNDAAALAGMIPYDSIGLYEPPKHRFIFKMPRVVPDQKNKFESDELFRRLGRESEVSALIGCGDKCRSLYLHSSSTHEWTCSVAVSFVVPRRVRSGISGLTNNTIQLRVVSEPSVESQFGHD